MTVEHGYLKVCIDPTHVSAYECARCNHVYCLGCDRSSNIDEIKSIVRYCGNWRCQREKTLEEDGEFGESPAIIDPNEMLAAIRDSLRQTMAAEGFDRASPTLLGRLARNVAQRIGGFK